MAGLYLYAVVPPETALPRLRGLEDAEVRSWAFDAFALWYSELDSPLPPTVEGARRHHAVVETAFRDGDTPLPLRFGQWLEDASALEAWVTERAPGLIQSLAGVAGAAEFGIRVTRVGPSDQVRPEPRRPSGASGTAYLQALARRTAVRREHEQEAQVVLQEIRRATAGLIRSEHVEKGESRRGLLALSHLVARAHQSEYRARVRDVRGLLHDLRFLVTGPWPPYSFSR